MSQSRAQSAFSKPDACMLVVKALNRQSTAHVVAAIARNMQHLSVQCSKGSLALRPRPPMINLMQLRQPATNCSQHISSPGLVQSACFLRHCSARPAVLSFTNCWQQKQLLCLQLLTGRQRSSVAVIAQQDGRANGSTGRSAAGNGSSKSAGDGGTASPGPEQVDRIASSISAGLPGFRGAGTCAQSPSQTGMPSAAPAAMQQVSGAPPLNVNRCSQPAMPPDTSCFAPPVKPQNT